MKKAAKWVAIGWSLFCLFGIIIGMANVGKIKTDSEYAEAGKTIGMGCGMGMWVGIWLAIAGPATIIYFLAGEKKEAKEISVEVKKTVTLCKECGKYYEGTVTFCPNCGKPTG